MSEYAVFFDPSHKRWWWIKRISTVLSLFAVVSVSGFLISLATTPLLPKMPGITGAIQRSIRRAVHIPRHQTRMQQFLLKRSRERLLNEIASEQRLKRSRAGLPPITGPGIVAAFYAPWQDTGLHSLRANAAKMTHVLPAWVHLTDDGRTLDFHDWDP